jgi:hypothetical protein
MRVTIIPADRWVRRDVDAANLPDWPFDDATIHAIQWYDTEGEIEYSGRPKPPNEEFTDPSVLQPYLTALDEYLAGAVGPAPTTEGNGPLPADEPQAG